MLAQHWMMMVMGVMILFGAIGLVGLVRSKKK